MGGEGNARGQREEFHLLRVHGGGAADLLANLNADDSGGFGAALGGGAVGAIEAKCGAGARVRLHERPDGLPSVAVGATAYCWGMLFVTLPLMALPMMRLLRREMMVPGAVRLRPRTVLLVMVEVER